MVFKPINLARQSFVKTFTHGYAQSLVAASQSSSAPQNLTFSPLSNNVVSFFNKSSHAPQIQHGPQPSTGPSGAGAKANQQDATGNEGGLAAYYAAWQKHQKSEEKEWHQFQFAKRIGWKAPTTIPDSQGKVKIVVVAPDSHVIARPPLERAYTTSAIEGIKSSREENVELSAITQAGETTTEEARTIEPSSNIVEFTEATSSVESVIDFNESVGSGSLVITNTPSHTASTAPTSIGDTDGFTEQLAALAENNRFSEIPAVFEALLLAGLKPSSSAYNALLLAAINLPRGNHQVVPKVLDVYADMLRRRVSPDTATYAILIEMLAARAVDVASMRKDLTQKQARFTLEAETFMFRSDEAEYQILAEDDSLSLAIRLFDTSAALQESHVFPAETYQSLVLACAEYDRISDMVRVYADMESRQIVPPTVIFAPMIQAFAHAGDLRSSIECYGEYKALAMKHDEGVYNILRKDDEVYAAVVRAYMICGRTSGGLKFLSKVEDSLRNTDGLMVVRQSVALQTLIPQWLHDGKAPAALEYAMDKLEGNALAQALTTICVAAADSNQAEVASESFKSLLNLAAIEELITPASSLLAMHLRCGNVQQAEETWTLLETSSATLALIEPATIYALSPSSASNLALRLQRVRHVFARTLDGQMASSIRTELVDRIDEATGVICQQTLAKDPVLSADVSMSLMWLATQSDALILPLAERLLAVVGPEDIMRMQPNDLNMLAQIQAGVILGHATLDLAHTARFAHMFDLILSSGVIAPPRTMKLVEQVLPKLGRPDLLVRWQEYQVSLHAPVISPIQMRSNSLYAIEETYDPYARSTDLKGSAFIAEELEKTYGRHSAHLNEALAKFRNIRRAGSHPRYVTYAKLITAAAKEERLELAREILAMAQQDVPLIAENGVVRHGWVSILDAMVGACLTTGDREAASRYHQELLNMGAAPSANTFGLYITTLKESTKTFDEATEAVKIFTRAEAEGVEPSSFLYNALIGKLGKARRIDDCLFHFAAMRARGIRPTSVTYGTVVNALCRVSDSAFAEELFAEMEAMPNYKPRPAPYNSLMQYFLSTKRDKAKVLAYHARMLAAHIPVTSHTYKLLIDTHATLEPIDMRAAEAILASIPGGPDAVHHASIIHAKGCTQHDMTAARAAFDAALRSVAPAACLYQALFEAMVANHAVVDTPPLLERMTREHRVPMTPYIANTLIHGWAHTGEVEKARSVYDALGRDKREPSTYEAMVRAYLAAGERGLAMVVVGEALRRGYPAAVAGKICELVGGGGAAGTTAAL